MRIAVGQMIQESNTFTTSKTHLSDFNPVTGDEVFKKPTWMKKNPCGGILETLKREGVEIVPTIFANAGAGGIVELQAYEVLKEGILGGIRRAGTVDGVCLALHGSMYVDGVEDPEGDLLTSLRKQVGSGVPIICSLDMHATITEAMIKASDGFTVYLTAPHVDTYETGVRTAHLLLLTLRNHISLITEWIRLPMLLTGEQSETDAFPMSELIANLKNMSQEPGILSASYALSSVYADFSYHWVSVIVVGDVKAQTTVRQAAENLAQHFWERRYDFDFTTEAYPLDEALTKALEDTRKPIIISDSGDNLTAGASGDISLVAKRMLDRGIKDVLITAIVDPESRRVCAEAGEGARVNLKLGRVKPTLNGPPLNINDARVIKLGNAHDSYQIGNPEIKCAVIEVKGITIVITEERGMAIVSDPIFLDDLNLTPKDFKIVIVKCGYLFPKYQPIAARAMLALTPGDTTLIFSKIPYKRLPRPIFPLDKETEWRVNYEKLG